MKRETLKALKKSIEHWERIANRNAKKNETIFGLSCPLCNLFGNGKYSPPDCDKCPVGIDTGRFSCGGTPWHNVNCEYNETKSLKRQTPHFYHNAKKELGFLKSLLPKSRT